MENDETKLIVGGLNQLNVNIRAKLLTIKSQVNSIEELDEVNTEVRNFFKQFESKLEELSICSEEAPSRTLREEIESDYNSYKSQLASLRSALRKANVECHAEIEKVSSHWNISLEKSEISSFWANLDWRIANLEKWWKHRLLMQTIEYTSPNSG